MIYYHLLSYQFLSIWDKIYNFDNDIIVPSIVSSTVLIALFVAGRFLDSLVERKRNSQEWYMKMVLEPNVKYLHEYFRIFLEDTQKFSVLLEQENSTDKKPVLFDHLANEKRKIEYNFILLVSNPYPRTAQKLTTYVNDLYDHCTTYLDSGNFTTSEFEKLEKEVMALKGRYFEEIYNPFKIKTTWQWFKNNYLATIIFLLLLFFLYTFIDTSTASAKEEEKSSKRSTETIPEFRQASV